MFSRCAAAGVIAIASLLLAPATVPAQTYWGSPEYSEGAACQKACPQDYSPCDPLYFKQADRRCQVDQRARGNHHR